MTEEGFEVVKKSSANKKPGPSSSPTQSIKTQRFRKYSWEEIEEFDTAEYISNHLIRNLLNQIEIVNANQNLYSKTFIKIPNIKKFEFFVKHLQYMEYLQAYHESLDHAKMKKLNSSLLIEYDPSISGGRIGISSSYSKSTNSMSSRSIYLSHTQTTSKNSNDPFNFFRPNRNDTNKNQIVNNSSWFKVKSAALNAIESKKNREKNNEAKNSSQRNSGGVGSGRIIGDSNWAPVREQLILNQSPKQKRSDQLQQQQFRCADCGIQISQNRIKNFNYCEYFCKYFCRCCHINSRSYIPAHIINSLDFKTTYEVCKKAKNFLEKIYNEPLVTLESLNPVLFQDQQGVFSRIKKLRFKLVNSRSYINTCRFAQEIRQKMYAEYDDFIINDQHVYSIDTLFKIKKTNYYLENLCDLVNHIVIHIKTCELCSQQGYICGFCNKSDFLYPFELEKVEKCPNCLACYHKGCFKTPEQCPRCLRKRNRAR
jgi:hypothetical protein